MKNRLKYLNDLKEANERQLVALGIDRRLMERRQLLNPNDNQARQGLSQTKQKAKLLEDVLDIIYEEIQKETKSNN